MSLEEFENELKRLENLATLEDVSRETDALLIELETYINDISEDNHLESYIDKVEMKFMTIRLAARSISIRSTMKKNSIADELIEESVVESSLNSSEQTINELIFSHLINPKIEICLGIDAANPIREGHLYEILKNLNISVSIFIWSSPNQINASSLIRTCRSGLSETSFSLETRTFKNIGAEISKVNWSRDSIKLFVYLKSESDNFTSLILNNTELSLEQKRIRLAKEIVTSRFDEQGRQDILDSFKQLIDSEKRFHFGTQLNNLKRCVVDNQDSFRSFSDSRNRSPSSSLISEKQTYFRCEHTKNNWSQSIASDGNSESLKIKRKIRENVSDYSRSAVVAIKKPVKKKMAGISYLSHNSEIIYLEEIILDEHSRPHAEKIYLNIIDVSLTTKLLAIEFNQRVKDYSVEVVEAFSVRDQDHEISAFGLSMVNIPQLSYHENDEQIKNLIDSFAHFTYEFTENNLLVIDLKSTFLPYRKRLILKEPVIFSKELKYGCSDMGPDGIRWFFDNHKCCSICRDWASYEVE